MILRWTLASRIAVALVCLTLGALAAANAIGLALASRAPTVALRYAPSNSTALGHAALRTLQASPDAEGRRRARTLAQRAVQRDSTNATAVSAFGLASVDHSGAARAFVRSDALSRRTLPTQLWMIENAVSQDDIPRALHHYDVALRTSRSAPAILFPVLAEAVGDADVARHVVAKLAARPAWGGLYLQYLAQNATTLQGATSIFIALQRKGINPGATPSATLYERLLAARSFDQAWRLYTASRPSQASVGIRNGDFLTDAQSPTPFDWTMIDGPAGLARIEGGRLNFNIAASEGGDVARQVLLLTPGRHIIQIVSGGIAGDADALPVFNLTCVGSNLALGRRPVPSRRGTAVRWTVNVPAGCNAQHLILTVPASSSATAVEGSIKRIGIVRS